MKLKTGSKGDDVKKLQELLNIQIDGQFGKNTEIFVKEFQYENGLIQNGEVDEKTFDIIKEKYENVMISNSLSLGSKGSDVVKLQKVLNLKDDGIFGKLTENAVKDYQKNNGLKSNGIADESTLTKLGFKKSDVYNKYITNNGLIIHKHYLSNDQYFKDSEPKYIFLHHTAGWHNPYNTINSWNKDNRGNVATEFVLGGKSVKGDDTKYDGVLVKCFPKDCWGWHLGTGRNDVHINSVGIEVNNFGYVTEGGYFSYSNNKKNWIKKESGKYYTYTGTEVENSQIVELEKPFRGYKFWHKYSDNQIETLKNWLHYIANRNNIDIRKGIPNLIKDKGADAFKYISDVRYGKIKDGVWSHTTVRKDKYDMFPQPELLSMLENL